LTIAKRIEFLIAVRVQISGGSKKDIKWITDEHESGLKLADKIQGLELLHKGSGIQNAVSAVIGKNRLNAEITFHIVANSTFQCGHFVTDWPHFESMRGITQKTHKISS